MAMLSQSLLRTLDLWGVRTSALLALSTGRRKATQTLHKVTGHSKPWGPEVTCGTRVTSHRCLSSGIVLGGRDLGGFSEDPQVKEWMKELHKDFNHQPEEKEDPDADRTEGRKEKEEEKDLDGNRMVGGEERIEKEVRGTPQKVWRQLVAEKYQKLDTHMQIIYDYDEERLRREVGLVEEKVKREKVKLERGKTGVFDVEELVDLLREDSARDMVVIQIPPQLKYVNYMVVVSSVSQRHRRALSELVKTAYKAKKNKDDAPVIIEGKNTDWLAMDMGNIVLHIMKPETRESYDLEMLWTVGAEYDEKSQVSEKDLVGVRRPHDPFVPPPSPPLHAPPEAVTWAAAGTTSS